MNELMKKYKVVVVQVFWDMVQMNDFQVQIEEFNKEK